MIFWSIISIQDYEKELMMSVLGIKDTADLKIARCAIRYYWKSKGIVGLIFQHWNIFNATLIFTIAISLWFKTSMVNQL